MNRRLSVLQKCALFKNKSRDEIESLLSKISPRISVLNENKIIFSPLENANNIGIILSGIVDMQKLFPKGKIVLIEKKKSTEMIGESSIFSKLDYYPDTFVASKRCEVLLIAKKELLKLFEIDNTILVNFLEHISNSTLILKSKIGILSLDSIQEKICGYLMHDYKMNNSCTITLPFSKKDWAEYINVSRTSLSRELRILSQQGIVSFNKRTIEIRDMRELEKILSL